MLEYSFVLLSILKLDHVLDKVVAVGILDQLVDVVDDVVGEVEFLSSGTLLEAPLHDAAAVLVHSDWDAVVDASLEDEIGVFACLDAARDVFVLWSLAGPEDHQERLDHMVAVHVNCQVHYGQVQLLNNLSKYLMVQCVILRDDKAWNLVERRVLLLRFLDDFDLAVDALKDAIGKSLDKDLDDSSAMDVQGDWNEVVDDLVHDLLHA